MAFSAVRPEPSRRLQFGLQRLSHADARLNNTAEFLIKPHRARAGVEHLQVDFKTVPFARRGLGMRRKHLPQAPFLWIRFDGIRIAVWFPGPALESRLPGGAH